MSPPRYGDLDGPQSAQARRAATGPSDVAGSRHSGARSGSLSRLEGTRQPTSSHRSTYLHWCSMAMEYVVQRLQMGDVLLIDVSGQEQAFRRQKPTRRGSSTHPERLECRLETVFLQLHISPVCRTFNPKVAGSIPARPTVESTGKQGFSSGSPARDNQLGATQGDRRCRSRSRRAYGLSVS